MRVVEIDQLPFNPDIGEMEGHRAACRHHQMQAGGRVGKQRLEKAADLRCGQEMAIIEDQEQGLAAQRKVVDDGGEHGIDRQHRA